MKVALTGATGFVGSHVLGELHANGHEVTALVRNDTQAQSVTAKGSNGVLEIAIPKRAAAQPRKIVVSH